MGGPLATFSHQAVAAVRELSAPTRLQQKEGVEAKQVSR